MKKKDKLAFPSVINWPAGFEIHCGMTRRELFAAMIMAGRLSLGGTGVSVREAVRLTDELIAELDKED